jgi:crotonobetainyl-CoA:carnitine CoA-transferase CaiB-like acyl-CoA transferase
MFQGLKVLELASVLAGPSVGQFFAELGADVIKVENTKTQGDVTRSWKGVGELTDDRSAYFCAVNWGKRSIALDLSMENDRAVISKLAKKSDVIIASYKPGDAEKLGVDYQTLSRLRPNIIYGQITGYGSHIDRVGYDAVLQAEAGFMYMNGEAGGKSLKMPVALIDVLAGHHLKEGLLLALLKHSRTSEGSLVEVSLLQAAVSSLVNQATNWLVAGSLPQKQGSAHPNIAPYGDTFIGSDGLEILLAVGNDKQFQQLCSLLGLSRLPFDHRFINNKERVLHRAELNEILQAKITNYSSGELSSKLFELRIPAGVIQNLEQVFNMDEARELIISSADLRGVRTYAGKTAATFTSISLRPPPHFGEHTSEILGGLS